MTTIDDRLSYNGFALLEPDTQLGPFRLIARIGTGGVGEVWKAEDTRRGRIVDIAIEEAGDRLVIIMEHVEGPRSGARRFSPLLGGVIAFLVAATLIGAALVWKMPKKRASPAPAPPSTTIAAPSTTNGAPASAGVSASSPKGAARSRP